MDLSPRSLRPWCTCASEIHTFLGIAFGDLTNTTLGLFLLTFTTFDPLQMPAVEEGGVNLKNPINRSTGLKKLFYCSYTVDVFCLEQNKTIEKQQ